MILLSIFLANLAKVLSTDVHNIPKENSKVFLRATDTYDNLIWFLQVGTYVTFNPKKFNLNVKFTLIDLTF